jgi:uncharacterized protein
MRFTWDPAKNASNVRGHGIAFQDAARIFDGPIMEQTDERFGYGEVRIYAIGLVNGIEITVIYTDRDPDERHIISVGDPNLMSDDTSGTTSTTEPKTDWRRLRSMTDEEVHAAIIDDPDAKPTDEAFQKDARVVMPRRKETVTVRLDADLL